MIVNMMKTDTVTIDTAEVNGQQLFKVNSNIYDKPNFIRALAELGEDVVYDFNQQATENRMGIGSLINFDLIDEITAGAFSIIDGE